MLALCCLAEPRVSGAPAEINNIQNTIGFVWSRVQNFPSYPRIVLFSCRLAMNGTFLDC